MNLTKILSFVFFLVAGFLAYYLYDSINSEIENEKRIAKVEKQVIKKLEQIRDAEIAFQNVNGRYTASWDSLVDFVQNGNIYIIQKTEKSELLDYGAEKITVTIDTIGQTSVLDSIFNKYPNFVPGELSIIPHSGKKFELFASTIRKGNSLVDVFEAKDVAPIDPKRHESHEQRNRKPLRVGSREEISTTGNWE